MPRPPKRKGQDAASAPDAPAKRPRESSRAPAVPRPLAFPTRESLVNAAFYPPEITNARCAEYTASKRPNPHAALLEALASTSSQRAGIPAGDVVLHWLKRDLRLTDNPGLSLAASKARELKVPLVCIYIISPQDLEAHLAAPARVDYDLRSLRVVQADLDALDIPLLVRTEPVRTQVVSTLLATAQQLNARHIFANIEYEVDELRRDSRLVKHGVAAGIDVELVQDACIVPPGQLKTGAGKQYAVYSPWYRAWMAHIHKNPHLLELHDKPAANPAATRDKLRELFGEVVPQSVEGKKLSDDEAQRYAALWPAGEHEGRSRLDKFIKEKVSRYKDTRNFPSENSTAMLSVHLAAGTISARECVRRAREANKTQKLDGGDAGIVGWISEVAWRDFYKHVLVAWPFVCMNKCFKPEYTDIEWEYNDDHFQRWCAGATGFPIVDAAMRQCLYMGYIHNRCRMIVASFLSKDLLLDWRMGEQYFMTHLIDGDFASNNGGWGFSASVGVDPQPYFRIFNPLLQSEKFDASGEYIRKWVPELKNVQGKAIHDPYGRGAAREAENAGYPRPMVDHAKCRARALERYKRGLGRETA